MSDEDDPVVASYDLCMTEPGDASRLYLLQYPSHRSRSKPYNAARAQAPTSLRLKPEAGFLEVDIPLLTYENYNELNGERFGKAMSDSRTLQVGGTHGMAGGFNFGSVQPRLRDITANEEARAPAPLLSTQTLGGKVPQPTVRDPVYLVGYLHNNKVHLSHLNAVVQMRPQLHHLDAEEESNQKRLYGTGNTGTSRPKTGMEPPMPKVESKAIEIRIKDTRDDAKDRFTNDNVRQLRDIQVDHWKTHEWVDEDEEEAQDARKKHMCTDAMKAKALPRLQSSLNNGDWLDRMSAPREDGKKGLLAKLRGRDREKQRRRKAEQEKRQHLREAAGAASGNQGLLLDMSEDSELTSPDVTDDEVQDNNTGVGRKPVDEVQVKQEPAPFPPSRRGLLATAPTPKKRGRPPKSAQAS